MKYLGKLVFGVAALMLASCSNDEPEAPVQNGNGNNNGNVYATLSVRMPSAGNSRAADSNFVGQEYGQENENYVGKVLVVLAKKGTDGRYYKLTTAKADARPGVKQDDLTKKYVLNFKSSDIENLAGRDDLYLFVYCNPTVNCLVQFDNDDELPFGNFLGTLKGQDASEIWTPNQFFMTNKEIVTTSMPEKTVLINQHNTPETAFSLGEVKVVRASARFDFKTTNDNLYPIMDIDNPAEEMGTVELTDMAMFNICKQFFYLPRTSPAETGWNWETCNPSGTPNYVLCGDLEDYVISYNKNNFKANERLSADDLNNFFCNIVGNDLTGFTTPQTDGDNRDAKALTWTSIRPSDWNKRTDDNPDSWDKDNNPQYANYKIWRYTTENTIPGNAGTSAQKVGITTGVVFKAVFTPNDKELWNNNVIYVYNNIVYGDFASLQKFVNDNPTSVVASDFKKVSKFIDSSDKSNLKENLLKGLTTEQHHGFTAYEPTADSTADAPQYRMYYFYYNRHDSNNDPSVMGDNEFGVVRNNVYKLAVTKIGRLGAPTATDNPDDPDEEENAYFTVSCVVMPWTVRVNNIEF